MEQLVTQPCTQGYLLVSFGAMLGFLIGIIFERWGCKSCKNILDFPAEINEALERAHDNATDVKDQMLIDKARVFINRHAKR